MMDYDRFMENAIQILNGAGVNLMDFSEIDRSRTLDLELEITKAANSGDTDRFLTSLDAWRYILMGGEEENALYQKEAA